MTQMFRIPHAGPEGHNWEGAGLRKGKCHAWVARFHDHTTRRSIGPFPAYQHHTLSARLKCPFGSGRTTTPLYEEGCFQSVLLVVGCRDALDEAAIISALMGLIVPL